MRLQVLEQLATGPVSVIARVRRWNSVTPSCFSSSLTWWLTAEGVSASRSAAALKLECFAAK